MAARSFNGEIYQLEPATIQIFGRATGAGAANMTALKGKGVTSITRTGTGAHTIVLADKYKGVLMAQFAVISTATADDYEVMLTSDLTSGTTVGIAIFKGGAAADLQTTDTLLFKFELVDTTTVPTSY